LGKSAEIETTPWHGKENGDLEIGGIVWIDARRYLINNVGHAGQKTGFGKPHHMTSMPTLKQACTRSL